MPCLKIVPYLIKKKGETRLKNPFWLNHQTCGYVFLFENHKDFELIAVAPELPPVDLKESAKILLDSLEGNECTLFLESLRDECINRLMTNKMWVRDALKELNKGNQWKE
jgi:hypothetical protein